MTEGYQPSGIPEEPNPMFADAAADIVKAIIILVVGAMVIGALLAVPH